MAQAIYGLSLPKMISIPPYGCFSGSDITASMYVPGKGHVPFGSLSTITYSTYRVLNPVRTLGRINPRGFVRGPRTIAGSLVFAVLDIHALFEVQEYLKTEYSKNLSKLDPDNLRVMLQDTKFISDELFPFDVTILMANEYGSIAGLKIYGVRIVEEGQTMSVQDMMTENVMRYVAEDIDLLRPMGVDESL